MVRIVVLEICVVINSFVAADAFYWNNFYVLKLNSQTSRILNDRDMRLSDFGCDETRLWNQVTLCRLSVSLTPTNHKKKWKWKQSDHTQGLFVVVSLIPPLSRFIYSWNYMWILNMNSFNLRRAIDFAVLVLERVYFSNGATSQVYYGTKILRLGIEESKRHWNRQNPW